MKKLAIQGLLVVVVLFPLFVLQSCKLEQTARDTIAAGKGAITAAQAQYGPTCKADPKLPTCVLINKGVDAQNAAVTALESYCGWSPAAPPADLNAPCVPVKSAEQALRVALLNLNQLTLEIKGALK